MSKKTKTSTPAQTKSGKSHLHAVSNSEVDSAKNKTLTEAEESQLALSVGSKQNDQIGSKESNSKTVSDVADQLNFSGPDKGIKSPVVSSSEVKTTLDVNYPTDILRNISKTAIDNLSSKPLSVSGVVIAKDVNPQPIIVGESSVLYESSNWKPEKPLETILPESSVSTSSNLSSDIAKTSSVPPASRESTAQPSVAATSSKNTGLTSESASDPSPARFPPTISPSSVDEPQKPCVTMSNPTEPESPPIAIPKASYAIDWDNFDENTNPFQSRNQLGSSPPRGAIGKPIPGEDFNPFKPSRKLAQSPTPSGEDKPERLSINNNDIESVSDVSGNIDSDVSNAVQNDKSTSNADGVKAGATIVK